MEVTNDGERLGELLVATRERDWTWLEVAITSAAFGYWQNNVAAGIFMFLFLLLLTRLLNTIAGVNTRIETLLHQRLEDPTGGCTGHRDCPCWWHTEQRTSAKRK